jgi:DNA recombination protein RmuC
MAAIWFAVGCVAGGIAGWLIANGRAQASLAIAEVKLKARDEELERARGSSLAQDAALERERACSNGLREEGAGLKAQVEAAKESARQRLEDEQQLKDAFSSLASDALHKNNGIFVDLAKEKLGEQQSEATGKLLEKETAIAELLRPVTESLTALSAHTHDLEVKREGAYSGLVAEIKNIKETHESLRHETHQLVSALQDSGTRGEWGAVLLKRCIEFAGMMEHCCFELEKFVRTDQDEAQRPDCVLTLPSGRTIVIDAKTPMKAFLDAVRTEDEALRNELLKQHARQLRTHLSSLEGKAYWRQFKDSPEFVICFLPKEALLSAALSQDPDLITYGDGTVILATPTTLIATLKAIAFTWKQVGLARDAREIHKLAVSIYEKLSGVHESFSSIGRNIKNAAASWEQMRRQIEGKGGVFSIGRKLQRVNVASEELAEIPEIHLDMHELQSEDWRPSPLLLPSLVAGAEDDNSTDE